MVIDTYFIFQAVTGADSINLSGSKRKTVELRQAIAYTGNDCEWIDLNAVSREGTQGLYL